MIRQFFGMLLISI